MINVVENNPYRILGVYANSPKRDILANEGKIKAFLKVGKAVSFPLDLNGLLPNASRTETSVVQAKSYLSLPQDQLKYAMFWFLNITPIDKIAFNHLFAGNMDEAVELWKKKECLSSLQNRMMCYLIKGKNVYAAGVADRLYFKYGSDFCNLISPTLKLGHEDFVNKFFDTLEGEMNVDLSSFSWERCSQLWKDTLNGRLVSPVISQIEACINKAKSVQRNSPSARYDAGVTLMNGTKPLIVKLKNVCASSDMRYQNVMDKLANEILQCGIDYYNGSEDDDKGEKAMPLQKYALQIAVGPMAKSRCQENVDILQRNIDNLPPMEVMANHKAIQLALKKFVAQPELIEYSIQLIKECAPHIVAIKEKLKDGVKETLMGLRRKGVRVYLLSDNDDKPSQALGHETGVDETIVTATVEEKARLIAEWQKQGNKLALICDSNYNMSEVGVKPDVRIEMNGAIGSGLDSGLDSGLGSISVPPPR